MAPSNNWPNASSFAHMVGNPKLAFKSAELQKCKIERDADGQPFGRSGAAAVVYKAEFDNGGAAAVKIFTSCREGVKERYQAISEHLENLPQHKRLPELVRFEYRDKSVRAEDGRWYPLVQMEWVKGTILQEWVKEKCHAGARAALMQAAVKWAALAAGLQRAEIAHGDLQQANIMVTPQNDLKLVDYDGMCVPALVGKPPIETGLPPYQHPDRGLTTPLSLSMDGFPALLIYVALRALAAAPDLWAKHVERDSYDKLLFRTEDLESPDASELCRDLDNSPDREVRELVKTLHEARRGNIGDVRPLADYLFSWEMVGKLLRERKYREAVEAIGRGGQAVQIPANLRAAVGNARQRVACHDELAEQVRRGNEEGMVRTYKADLLEDFPAAREDVAKARQAAQVISIRGQLQKAANDHRELIRIWDQNAALLKERVSMRKWGQTVENWRERDRLCQEVLRLLAQPTCGAETLHAAWDSLRGLGGHPDCDQRAGDVARCLERLEAWEPVCEALDAAQQHPGGEADKRVVTRWKDTLFKDWPPAEKRRAEYVGARDRRSTVEEIQRLANRPSHSPADAKRIAELANELPPNYEYEHRKDVDSYREQTAALERLEPLLKGTASELEIVAAATELKGVGGEGLLSPDQRERVSTANNRIAKIRKIKEISLDLPLDKLPLDKLDRQLLEAWPESDSDQLQDCLDVEDWRPAREAAGLRAAALALLERAAAGRDDAAVYRAAHNPLLSGYPLRDAVQARVTAVEAGIGGAQRLADSLRANDRRAFVAQFDARLIRTYGQIFQDEKACLLRWTQEVILRPATLQLDFLPAGAPLSPGETGDVSYARWRFPPERFADECFLAVCRQRKYLEGDPRGLPEGATAFCMSITRDYWRRSGAGCEIRPRGRSQGCHVAVWAIVDLGEFGSFVSEPLVLGTIGATTSRARGVNPTPRW